MNVEGDPIIWGEGKRAVEYMFTAVELVESLGFAAGGSKALPFPDRRDDIVGRLDRVDRLFSAALVSKALPVPCAFTAVLRLYDHAFHCGPYFK